MGVDPRAKTMSEANGGGRGATPKERMAAAGRPGPEELADALEVIEQEVAARLDADPRNGPPKLSLAKLAQGDWCASLTNWNQGVGLSKFSPDAREAVCKLATGLARGEEWKQLPKRP